MLFLPYFILFIQNMNVSYHNLPSCMIPFQLVDHYILRRVLPAQFSVDSSLWFHLRRLQNTVPRHPRLHTCSPRLKCKTKIAVNTYYISFVNQYRYYFRPKKVIKIIYTTRQMFITKVHVHGPMSTFLTTKSWWWVGTCSGSSLCSNRSGKFGGAGL